MHECLLSELSNTFALCEGQGEALNTVTSPWAKGYDYTMAFAKALLVAAVIFAIIAGIYTRIRLWIRNRNEGER